MLTMNFCSNGTEVHIVSKQSPFLIKARAHKHKLQTWYVPVSLNSLGVNLTLCAISVLDVPMVASTSLVDCLAISPINPLVSFMDRGTLVAQCKMLL